MISVINKNPKGTEEPLTPDPLRDLVMLDSPDLTPERAAALAAQAALAAAAPDALNPNAVLAAQQAAGKEW
jgi:hypothetical protein